MKDVYFDKNSCGVENSSWIIGEEKNKKNDVHFQSRLLSWIPATIPLPVMQSKFNKHTHLEALNMTFAIEIKANDDCSMSLCYKLSSKNMQM